MRKLLLLLSFLVQAALARGQGDTKFTYQLDKLSPVDIAAAEGSTHIDIDASHLDNGVHDLYLHYTGSDGTMSITRHAYFIKTVDSQVTYDAIVYVDGKDYDRIEINGAGGILKMNPDFSKLPYGLHSISVILAGKDGTLSKLEEKMFMRIATDDELCAMNLHCILDGHTESIVTHDVTQGIAHIDLDVSNLSPGFHSLGIFASGADGLTTPLKNTWFVKLPEEGGAIREFRYVINGDVKTEYKVELDKTYQQFTLMDMLDIPQEPFRSENFRCQPQDDGSLMLTANNDITMLFIGAGGGVVSHSSQYNDVREIKIVNKDMPIIEQGGNGTLHLPRPVEQGIHWYRIEVEPGALLILKPQSGCIIDIFDSEGNVIIRKERNESTQEFSTALTEGGIYYLAVHDFQPYVSSVDLDYCLLNRHALLGTSCSRTVSRDMFFVDINGNGFDNLSSLEYRLGDTVLKPSEYKVHSNTSLSARFDFDGSEYPEGKYELSAVFKTEDGKETISLDNALEIVKDGNSLIDLDIDAPAIATTPYEAHIVVKNSGDAPAWGIPLNIALGSTDTGYSVQFKNFYPCNYGSMDSIGIAPSDLITENLLGSGKRGIFLPVVIPYLGVGEELRFTMGFRSSPHEKIPVYAWCAEPWSESALKMKKPDFDFESVINPNESNLATFAHMVYLEALRKETTADTSTIPRSHKRSLQRLQRANDLANTAANVGVAAGQACGGLVNGMRLHGLNATAQAYGVDLSSGEYGSLNDYADRLRQGMPTPGSIIAEALGWGDLYRAGEEFFRGCSNTPTQNSGTYQSCQRSVDCYQSGDPNDMHGYTDPTGGRFIGKDIKKIQYVIEFENDPSIANASAMSIKVTDRLDPALFDFGTFRATELRIGKKTIELPEGHKFVKTLDMRPEINAIAELHFDFDAESGVAEWQLYSLDPMTMDRTRYLEQGVLPVNDDYGAGIGYLTFSVNLANNLVDKAIVTNRASIVFDDNRPIDTPVFENITDFLSPVSRIIEMNRLSDTEIDFTIEEVEDGSGIWKYALYAQKRGDKKWSLIRDNIDNIDSSTIRYVSDTAFPDDSFYCVIATDKAGNMQDISILSKIMGDADSNGTVDVSDNMAIKNHFSGTAVGIDVVVSDLNLDGAIDVQDAMVVKSLFLQTGRKNIQYRKNKK